jgi:hypothetical protein
MFGLPDNYLNTYRSQIQSVTREQIQEVALKYVRPDEAAIVIVGDGNQLSEQIKPYAENIEFYNTAGKRKTKGEASSAKSAALYLGDWTLQIDTPLGQSIPATLTLTQNANGLSGKVESEMGSGELLAATVDGDSLSAIVSLDVAGHAIEANISAEVTDNQIEGTISLQDAPALTFIGTREKSAEATVQS